MKHAVATTMVLLILIVGMSAIVSAEVTQNLVIPFNAVIGNACLGESVALTGNLHILVIQQRTGNGMLMASHSQPAGVSGTGVVSGASYRGTGVTRNVTFNDGTPPFDFTLVNNFRIVGSGSANNYMVHSTIHMTVNANGEVTAEVTKTETTCRP